MATAFAPAFQNAGGLPHQALQGRLHVLDARDGLGEAALDDDDGQGPAWADADILLA